MPQLSLCVFLLILVLTSGVHASEAPKDLNTPRQFPLISTLPEWQARAEQIRQQVLVSCGLWPLPEKTPLHARIFGKIEREGYSVEKVYLQPMPGFFLCGNLYRPLGRGKGPFPAILNPHGHWREGRLADTKDGSIAARCISFARQGMIAFSYDMVGYNDTFFPDHGDVPPDKLYLRHQRFASNHTNLLWNISKMGLQTWNSIRALDFLESLPDVDRKRLACTGESGGGTQTFMLGAIDDRLVCQAPVVMVSHTMQGGCSCENAPGLRVEYSNMEIAAAAAPRPQILVAATGDWTRATMTVEGPAIQRIYELFGAKDKFHYVLFDYNHNYNQTSREAVYDWFAKWVPKDGRATTKPTGAAAPGAIPEEPYSKEPDADLRVFPDGKLPAAALTEQAFINSWIERRREDWAATIPKTKSFDSFRKTMLPGWQHTLLVDWPISSTEGLWRPLREGDAFRNANLQVRHPGDDARVSVVYFPPISSQSESGSESRRKSGASANPSRLVVLADPDGRSATCDASGEPGGIARQLVARGIGVLAIKAWSTTAPSNSFANFYSTYNRTLLQQRVRDLIAVSAQARTLVPAKGATTRVILCASGRAGLWAMLAAPGADAVVADCDRIDAGNDETMLQPDLFCPGIRTIGTFEGATMLAAPHPLLLHNLGGNFPTEGLAAAYKALRAGKKMRIEPGTLADDDLVRWISSLD